MASNIDISKIQREIAILSTNSVELMNKMYEIFVEPTPCDVELRVWTPEGFETISIPNLAKSKIPVEVGEGYPTGLDDLTIGSIYIDTQSEKVYIKIGESDSSWFEFASLAEIEEHNTNEDAHMGTLARVHGSVEEPFYVSDTDNTSDGGLAVNVNSLNFILGKTEGLGTGDNDNLVNAINELLLTSEKEAAAIVDVNNNRVYGTRKPKLFRIISTDQGDFSLATASGLEKFTAIKANGQKYTCDTASDIEPLTSLTGNKLSVFLKDLDKETPAFECVVGGDYFIGETRPFIMKEGDVWLDTGCKPYHMYQVSIDDGAYVDNEVDFIYLGTVEEI